jgi:hypothetical protein
MQFYHRIIVRNFQIEDPKVKRSDSGTNLSGENKPENPANTNNILKVMKIYLPLSLSGVFLYAILFSIEIAVRPSKSLTILL